MIPSTCCINNIWLLFIGIINIDDVKSDYDKAYFDKNNHGYALCSVNGTIFHNTEKGESYANGHICLRYDDIVEIKCNLSSLHGTISYSVNDKDYGVAFKNIDATKTYKLCVEMRG